VLAVPLEVVHRLCEHARFQPARSALGVAVARDEAGPSILMCFETAGWLISNGAASSRTEASPCARRARMARLVGSASAVNTASRRSSSRSASWRSLGTGGASAGIAITFLFQNELVIYTTSRRVNERRQALGRLRATGQRAPAGDVCYNPE
jgi:hypothetical protein